MQSAPLTRFGFLTRIVMLLVLATGVVAMPGCSGCRQAPEERLAEKIKKESARQKKKKPKPNFRSPGTVILPGKFPDLENKTPESLKEMSTEQRSLYLRNLFNRVNRTKPGHWLETSTPTIANNFNQKGQINTLPMGGAGPDLIPGTPFEFATARSFSLVQGQWKYLPSTVYLPPRPQSMSANMVVNLSTGNDALPFYTVPLATTLSMQEFQYHLVVLSNRFEQMRYLQFTDSVQIRQSEYSRFDTPPFYYVVTNMPGKPIPLPRNALNWTTTAYLVWDDLDPDDLTPDQQQALVDWLHFGGQLILSGPDCLTKLEASFLADYLPAQSEGKTELDAAAFAPLNKNWSVPNRTNPTESRSVLITDANPVIGIEFKPHRAANFVTGTGALTIERMIGRGRVVATAFSLTSPTIKSWGSFPSYFHNALLRKPRRKFGVNDDTVVFDWVDDASVMYDPLIGTNLRFISRDLRRGGTPTVSNKNISKTWAKQHQEAELLLKLSGSTKTKRNLSRTRHYGGFAAAPTSGVGGWSDTNAIAQSARAGLRSAAGITPPSADLILKMLGVYLLILVPLNWLLFRAIGKVEWAWAAVPLIAIIGAITVVKIASLDIGFARSNTQVALLEIHNGYQRGHLSQYSALYTSLSTNYGIELDNGTGIALPLSAHNVLNGRPKSKVSPKRLTLQQSLTNRTENFQIQSNSTGLLHAEWIQDVGGDFRLLSERQKLEFKALTLQNNTTVELSSAGIIGRDHNGNYFSGWIGDFAANEGGIEVTVNATNKFDLPQLWAGANGLIKMRQSPQQILERFAIENGDRILLDQIKNIKALEPFWETIESQSQPAPDSGQPSISRSQFLAAIGKANLNAPQSLVGSLLSVVLDDLELGKGEIRLLGASDQRIGKTRFDPESTQTTTQTLIVAHLRQPDLPPALRDLNAVVDFTNRRSALTDDNDDVFDGTIE